MPPPPSPALPLNFLPVQEAWSCLLCEDVNNEVINLSVSTRNAHYAEHHADATVNREASQTLISVQTFCEQYNAKRYFRVYPELATAQALDADEQYAVLPASVADLVGAYFDEWTPAGPHPVSVESLKEVQPFVYYTGWAHFIENKDVTFLRSLIEIPGKDDELHFLISGARDLFDKDQKGLSAVSEVIRLGVMDDETGYVVL